MNESKHARARRAAVLGILLQLGAFATLVALRFSLQHIAAEFVAWLLLAGVPMWFAALLVLRQKELAALEREDWEELRREKEAAGGEALFTAEGAGGLGYQVAESRLQWMIRWLVPALSLLAALLMAAAAYLMWASPGILAYLRDTETTNAPITITILAVVMLLLFLLSRYAAGLARVPDWQLLRGPASYMLLSAAAVAALLTALTARWYAGLPSWEVILAQVTPIVLGLLAVETLVHVILDVYRPRRAGVEPRAAFDSRLLGVFSEPGGIAQSLAEAINYQFGFEVSQSWFFRLVQKSLVLILGTGALALWGLSTVVIVYPNEHAIIERFGRQLNAETPYGPGLHFKYPWPFDKAYRFATGTLNEMIIGYRDFDAQPKPEAEDPNRAEVVLWSQEEHRGQRHFDFVIAPKDGLDEAPATQPADTPLSLSLSGVDATRSVPVNLIRMFVSVQYKIDPTQLAAYTQQLARPEETLKNLAWAEVVKFNAAHDIDELLAEAPATYSFELRERIAAKAQALNLGLDVVYVGLYNVHPEKSVAEAYREVINATQQRTGSIREALVIENATLAAAAGDKRKAYSFVLAINELNRAEREILAADSVLRALDPAVQEQLREAVAPLRPLFEDVAAASERLRRAEQVADAIEQEFEAGIGSNLKLRARAAELVAEAQGQLDAAEKELQDAVGSLDLPGEWSAEQHTAAIRRAQAAAARDLWNNYLVRDVATLDGAAAAILAQGQAERWDEQMQAESQYTQLVNEKAAYEAGPNVYRTREYLAALAESLSGARKYFFAVRPSDREFLLRILGEDEQGSDPFSSPLVAPGP